MLTDGSRIHGCIDGHNFTGNLGKIAHYADIRLDRAIMKDDRYCDRLYVEFNPTTGQLVKKSQGWIAPLPEPYLWEAALQPLTCFAVESLKKESRRFDLGSFKDRLIHAGTTWRTVKRSETCEYGHKHTVEWREPVPPVIKATDLHIAFAWHCIGELMLLTDQADYIQRNECWSHLAALLSLGGGAFMNRPASDYQGLDHETIRTIESEMDRQYAAMCQEYKAAIYGDHLARYERSQAIISGKRSA